MKQKCLTSRKPWLDMKSYLIWKEKAVHVIPMTMIISSALKRPDIPTVHDMEGDITVAREEDHAGEDDGPGE
ncbi:hypothetical protein BV898_10827 [Hypsibius exemplaris]|uniref:Uncharacterized protein n=1 Tax=Hypsibius exemplaris TaxID=2072580 RepID=A0A1W0WIB3_HYPEX|nr:hypothetical protein BV898_10827 [Hypsibius exemplaris]